MVLGIVGLLIAVGLVAAGVTFYQRHKPAFEQYQDCLKRAGSDRSARDTCRQRLDDAINGRR